MSRASLILFLLSLSAVVAQDKGKAPDEELPPLHVDLETGGHVGTISRVFFSHDGKQLISVSKDATIRYWSLQSGELLRTLRFGFYLHPSAFAQATALSADRRTLVVNQRVGVGPAGRWTLLTVDLVEGKLAGFVRVGPAPGLVVSMALSPDGTRLATGHWEGACVWNAKTGEKLFEMQRQRGEDPATSVAFSPDGKHLAVLMVAYIHIVDLETKKVATHYAGGHLKGLFWSPDGSRVAVAHRSGVSLINPKTGKAVAVSDAGTTLTARWSRNGEFMLTGGRNNAGGRVSLLRVEPGLTKANLIRHYDMAGLESDIVNDAVLSPDGKLVAAAAGPDHAVRVWRRVSGEVLYTMKGRGGPFQIAGWSDDSNTIAWARALKDTGRTPFTEGFDLANLRLSSRKSFARFQRSVREDADGRELNLGDPSTPPRTYKGMEKGFAFQLPVGHAISGTFLEGKRVALGTPHGLINYFDAVKGGWPQGKLVGHRAEINALAPSPNGGKYLLSASSDQTLKIWSVKEKEERLLLTLFVAERDWVIWTPEGYYAATPGGEKMMGWRLRNGPREFDSFFTAERFRKRLERPDVIKLVLVKGSVAEAVTEANRLAKREDEKPVEAEPDLPPSATLELVRQSDNKYAFKVTAKARSKSQPVTALRLQVDGRSFPDGKFAKSVDEQLVFTVPFDDVELPPGPHEMRVMVRGKDTSDVSNSILIKADLANAAKPKLYCLPIGINYDWDPKLIAANLKLDAAQNDAGTLLKALRENCAGPGNRYQTVVGEPLLGKEATRQAILDGILNLRKKGAQPGDTAVIFYAGHGVTEGRKFYLLTADVDPKNVAKTGLSGSDLREALKELPCQVLMVFDACQSGAALPNFAPATDELGRALSDDEAAVTVLAAARGDEAAGEQKGNGRLTLAMAKALAGGAGVGYDPYEYTVNIHNVYSFVHAEVRQASKGKQNPVLLAPWSAPPLVLRKVAEKTNP